MIKLNPIHVIPWLTYAINNIVVFYGILRIILGSSCLAMVEEPRRSEIFSPKRDTPVLTHIVVLTLRKHVFTLFPSDLSPRRERGYERVNSYQASRVFSTLCSV